MSLSKILEALTGAVNGECECDGCKARRKNEEHISSNYEVKGIAVNGASLAQAIIYGGRHNINRANVLEGIEILGAFSKDTLPIAAKMPGIGDQMVKLVMLVKMMRLVHQYLQGVADAIKTVGQDVAEAVRNVGDSVVKDSAHTKPVQIPKITATIQVMGDDLASWRTFKGIMEFIRNEALGGESALVTFDFQEPAAKA